MIMAKHESMINAWRERVMECKTSGLTVAEWCERNHINKKGSSLEPVGSE